MSLRPIAAARLNASCLYYTHDSQATRDLRESGAAGPEDRLGKFCRHCYSNEGTKRGAALPRRPRLKRMHIDHSSIRG